MEPFGTGLDEGLGLFDGVVLIGYLPVVVTLDESDTFAFDQVNRWYNVHFFISPK